MDTAAGTVSSKYERDGFGRVIRARMNKALQALGVAAGPYTPGQVKGVRIEAAYLNAIVSRVQ